MFRAPPNQINDHLNRNMGNLEYKMSNRIKNDLLTSIEFSRNIQSYCHSALRQHMIQSFYSIEFIHYNVHVVLLLFLCNSTCLSSNYFDLYLVCECCCFLFFYCCCCFCWYCWWRWWWWWWWWLLRQRALFHKHDHINFVESLRPHFA